MPQAHDDPADDRERSRQDESGNHRPLVFPLRLVLFFAAYVLAGGFSEGLALIPGIEIRFWPPSGIFVAVLLLSSPSRWPWWTLAGCLAELCANVLWFHNSWPLALLYYSANALEALTAAILIRRFAPRPFRLETVEEVAAFVALGAIVAPMTSATVIAATDAILGKHPFFVAWILVWVGDGTGLLVSTPLTFVAAQAWTERGRISRWRIAEAGALALILLSVGALAFRGYLSTAYMMMPPLLWIAARFQLRGAAAALAFITLMTAVFTATGVGEFASQRGLTPRNIVMLQAFLGISAVSALIVAAVSQQHQLALRRLRTVNAELEARVAERTANLRESEERLRLAAEATGFGVYEFDPRGGKVSWSREFKRIFGFPEEAMEDVDAMLSRLHPDDRDRFLAETRKLGEIDQSADDLEMEFRIVLEDGQARWLQDKARFFRTVDGRPSAGRIIGTVLDVTDRKRAEQALRESEERFRNVFEHAGTGIAITAPDGMFLRCNPAYRAMLGYSEAELRSTYFSALIHPEDREDNVELGLRLLNGELPSFEIENRYVHKGGQSVWVRKFVSVLRDDAGEPVCYVVLATDMTARRAVEQALRDADRRKDEFLATLAHELRNPLAPVRNAVHVLRLKGPAVPELQWARGVIDRQVQAMSRLIDDLMDLSRINRGKIELKRERIELARIAQGAVETSRPLIDEMGHDLTVALPSESVILDADLTRLAQVFQNLLNNAAKYMERGGRIEFRAEREGSDVVVSVRDTGIGIPADKLPAIFDMFSQVEGALSRSRGGLGIGLCLAKQLVEMHGGRITARSDGLGKGSEFTVRLPVPVDPALADSIGAGDVASPREAPSGLRILVVDDNRDGAETLAMLLEISGNQVRVAHDGEAGLAAAEEFRPDVVLCDIGLPKLNGYEVCKRVRRQAWGESMILIAVTGWGQEADKRTAREAGFHHHLVKPVDPQSLMKLLTEFKIVNRSAN